MKVGVIDAEVEISLFSADGDSHTHRRSQGAIAQNNTGRAGGAAAHRLFAAHTQAGIRAMPGYSRRMCRLAAHMSSRSMTLIATSRWTSLSHLRSSSKAGQCGADWVPG